MIVVGYKFLGSVACVPSANMRWSAMLSKELAQGHTAGSISCDTALFHVRMMMVLIVSFSRSRVWRRVSDGLDSPSGATCIASSC